MKKGFRLMICCVPRSILLPLSPIYAASLHHLFVKLFVRAPQKLKFAPRAPPPTHPGNARSGHVSFRRTDEQSISPSIRPSLQFSRFASVENCKRRGKMGQSRRRSVRACFRTPSASVKISVAQWKQAREAKIMCQLHDSATGLVLRTRSSQIHLPYFKVGVACRI